MPRKTKAEQLGEWDVPEEARPLTAPAGMSITEVGLPFEGNFLLRLIPEKNGLTISRGGKNFIAMHFGKDGVSLRGDVVTTVLYDPKEEG